MNCEGDRPLAQGTHRGRGAASWGGCNGAASLVSEILYLIGLRYAILFSFQSPIIKKKKTWFRTLIFIEDTSEWSNLEATICMWSLKNFSTFFGYNFLSLLPWISTEAPDFHLEAFDQGPGPRPRVASGRYASWHDWKAKLYRCKYRKHSENH